MDKCYGSLLGCAVGDALGIAQEIFVGSCRNLQDISEKVKKQRNKRKSIGIQTEYEDGGPWADKGFIIKAGTFTDDTSMMLCLTDSILQNETVDTADLILKFRNWWYEGYNSSTGISFGLGHNTSKALNRYDPKKPYEPTGGRNAEKDAGNGAIMRLAPVPIYWKHDLSTTLKMARAQTVTTHNVIEALDGSALLSYIIWHAINGEDKDTIFGHISKCALEHEGIRELTSENARWKTATEDDIITLPGRCLWTLEAAIWCIHNTDNFSDAIIKAINLGGDADTVGAVTGQIAGALYGIKNIPPEWLDGLHHKSKILMRVEALYAHLPFTNDMIITYR
jgi:ADP-ribosyl-[dinitrogen reductase] hydrolase